MELAQIRFILGIIGNIISIGLFLSPVPTFMDIIKKKSVQEYKPDPYLATMLNCAMWVFYGMPFVHPDSLLVITINAAGFGLEMVYVVIFFIYMPVSRWKKMITILIGELVFCAAVIVCTLIFVHGTATRTIVVGSVCVAFNIIMYAAPLTVISTVIKTKSVKYMPLPLSLAGLLNGAIWLTYACVKFDPWIAVPNCLGVISGLVQLVLHAMYYKTTKPDEEENDRELADVPAEP